MVRGVVSGLALEPRDSYFITWLSRGQSGFKWPLKTSAEAIVMKILLNDEVRGNPNRKLSGPVAYSHCRLVAVGFPGFLLSSCRALTNICMDDLGQRDYACR